MQSHSALSHLQRIERSGVIAVMRGMQADTVLQVARALKAGGIDILEVTVDAPGALRMIEKVTAELGNEALIGAGTVLDPETARAAISAGAQFIFSPTLNTEVIEMANRYGKAVIPGVMTPTEIVQACSAGASAVKIFPAGILGPSYLRQIRGPLPQIPLIPTGGIGAENAAAFIHAGAMAVGVGGALVDLKAISAGHFDIITEKAKELVRIIQEARSRC
ncbi:MAG: bifunctional 4-hydroxy-2-oxoglutarate aldolase/2-dehydro-3-deoxy-phosphogluconate aldolase [Firmicutes bacterium]|jgi:2-dehydro-3-deoxyphosphogluconate aldolase/(4S)-4-hydroxy-2-oxoglutarate aldolase|nr:bifunctional 4-hydroxy-2-oxoglutarate aldolase/2-dehydro-3-deoxy-phosphogluconate aldolase [Bacillota bacterium]